MCARIIAQIESLESRRLLSAPAGAVQVGDTLFFAATDADHGRELWKSNLDGSNPTLVKDIAPGPDSSDPQWLTNFNGVLYFSADYLADGGDELYRSDGTEAGTFRVVDLYPYAASSSPHDLMVINNNLIYIATAPTAYDVLWANDGTRLFPGDPRKLTEPRDLTAAKNVAYFLNGYTFWRTDGTVGGTRLAGAMGLVLDGKLLVSGTDGNDQISVDASNGTTFVTANGHTQSFNSSAFNGIEVHGLAGDDTITLSDNIVGQSSLYGELGNDSIRGGAGNDLIDDDQGDDTVDGAGGDDTFIVGAGDDTLIGGDGSDTADYSRRGEPLKVDPQRIGTREEIDAYNGIETILSATTLDHVSYVAPVAYNDYTDSGSFIHVSGNSANNNILIRPTADPQKLEVVADGVSQLVYVFTSSFLIYVDGHEGNDTVTIDPAIHLNATIIGGAGNDSLVGGSGNDRLDGGAGNDTLIGNDGDDTLIANMGNDSVDGGAGNNTIDQPSPPPATTQALHPSMSRGILSINGTRQDDTILIQRNGADASRFNVVLDGVTTSYRFSDVTFIQIDGKAGNDHIEFSQSGTPIALRSKIYGGAGNDVIYGSAAADQIHGGDGNDWINAGSGNDAVYGESGNDRIFGGDGNDHLDSGAGSDLVRGDGGRDRIIATIALDDYTKNRGDLLSLAAH